jgi:hypothetical protein
MKDSVAPLRGGWIELYNAGLTVVNLLNWRLFNSVGDSMVILTPFILQAGKYAVLAPTATTELNELRIQIYRYAFGEFPLSTTAGSVVLTDPNFIELDRVEYSASFPTPTTGVSLALKSPLLDNRVGTNWCTATTTIEASGNKGTPGTANNCPA